MAEHLLQTSLALDLSRDKVFEFFSNAENLEAITPPDVGFHILTPLPIDLHEGTLIDYELSLFGFPVKWRTEITKWDPPNEFIDVQVSGLTNSGYIAMFLPRACPEKRLSRTKCVSGCRLSHLAMRLTLSSQANWRRSLLTGKGKLARS